MRAQPASRAGATAERDVEHVDRAIAELAAAQDGVVSHAQMIALGLSRRAIGHRLRVGRLHAIHRGVYAVGHWAVSDRGRGFAALLAAGPDAPLSHRAAGYFLAFVPELRARLDVTRADGRRRSRSAASPDRRARTSSGR